MPAQAATYFEREFVFTDRDFKLLAELARERTGIVLNDSKRDMVYARLARRLRSLDLSTFADYRTLIRSDDGAAELANMINAITTNLTKFFREAHHFEHLKAQVFEPAVAGSEIGNGRKLRLWSAGCSSGEEAYSIAMTMAQTIAYFERWDARILATDLDTNMLNEGASAVYSAERLENVPEDLRRRFISPVRDGGEDGQIGEALRRLVTFKHLNLLGPWPLRQPYDAIFCRNVVIYFDGETKIRLVRRLVQQLKIGGFLYLGHSESLMAPSDAIRLVGRTTYERIQ